MEVVKHNRQSRPTGPRVERLHRGEFQVLGIEALSPTFVTRAEAEAWLQAHLAKASKAKRPQPRSCMCCGKGFESEGFHNRLCQPCRLRANQDQDVPFSFGAVHGRKRA